VQTASNKTPAWQTDYNAAMEQAKREHKMLLVFFHSPTRNQQRDQVERKFANDPRIQAKLDKFVLVKVPTNAKITMGGKPVTISRHPAFAELRGHDGIAIIDLAYKGTEHYGDVVSAIPFAPGKYYHFRPEHLNVVVGLPPGTLTQRTMIFAVRIHPEAPASAWGEKDPVLTSEAASHSRHQAQVRVQGHHSWDSRFQRIIGRLLGRRAAPRRSAPVEVVAESWPNQNLVDSCVDCVHSWRQSPGHWSAVKARQAAYGYDIRRGGNGIWYATGIFAK
jgi:hypothetical protein